MSKAFGGLIFGIFLGYVLHISANEKICAVIFIVALDAICGGAVAKINKTGLSMFNWELKGGLCFRPVLLKL